MDSLIIEIKQLFAEFALQIVGVIKISDPVLIFLMIAIPFILNDKLNLDKCLKAKFKIPLTKAQFTALYSFVIMFFGALLFEVTWLKAFVSFALAQILYSVAIKNLLSFLKGEKK